MSADPDRPPDEGLSASEPPTQPTESPTHRIRAALVDAICDGPHRPFSQEALAAQRQGRERLHALVRAYTAHLKSRGVPPERAVGFMKSLVSDTEIPCHRPMLALEADIMAWCIDAYYGATGETGDASAEAAGGG